MSQEPHRIDVHHHVFPPGYVDAVERHGDHDSGGVPFPKWSVEDDLAFMDRCGIATALTSVSAPGVSVGDAARSRALARRVNEYQARLVDDHPTRFGAFASLPVPDVDGALDELSYALDALHMDGVVLLASVGDVYLGDPRLEPLFAELDRRRAVVFVHPNVPASSRGLKLALPHAALEFVFDTTRAVANRVYTGTLDRYPNVRIILSHAGGTIPFLAGRLATTDPLPELARRAPLGSTAYLKRLYYDTAISAVPTTLGSLRELVGPSHILFGSDAPFLPEPSVRFQQQSLAGYGGFDAAGRQAIERDSALALFPRLARPARVA
jgi:6-methylsalicylate decarboxylase